MVEKKTNKKVQKEKNNKKENGRFTIGIKGKLTIGFAIPLVCTIIVGMGAYSLAASGLTKNYEDSMLKALSMAILIIFRQSRCSQ